MATSNGSDPREPDLLGDGLRPMTPGRRRGYAGVNTSSSPFFLAMIIAPRSALTRRLAAAIPAVQAGLGLTYAGTLTAGVLARGRMPDFRDPDDLRVTLAQQDGFLAGWTHYISFDLFVGHWIWRDALRRGRTARLALFLTWMAGPVGLTWYAGQRLIQDARATE